jgi:hypothetical protein
MHGLGVCSSLGGGGVARRPKGSWVIYQTTGDLFRFSRTETGVRMKRMLVA